MSKHLKVILLAALALSLLAALPAVAHAKTIYKTSTPVLSGPPTMGMDFSVSGVITPASSAKSRATVKIRLLMKMEGKWDVMDVFTAGLSKMPAGKKGTKYSRTLSIPMMGEHAVQAFQYRGGKLVSKSQIVSFDVQPAALRITIDSMVNGWLAPSLGNTMAPADTPLDIVFSTPSDWASDDPAKRYGAAHFIWGDFEKVDADGLVWHTDGLRPGRYDWMRDVMPKWGTGSLVVAQRIDLDKTSHADTHALPYLPADVSFGDVSAEGMGCDRSIAFLTRVFAQTTPDPLVWHTDGLAPGRYDWKCWMDDCHYGTLVADSPSQQVVIDSDPLDSVTMVPAGTPVVMVFTGARTGAMSLCWRTIHFMTAGDFTKTRGYPDPLTLYSGGLASGSYEWECWMGPQCHHGTIVVQ
jgi:hypothetical protein